MSESTVHLADFISTLVGVLLALVAIGGFLYGLISGVTIEKKEPSEDSPSIIGEWMNGKIPLGYIEDSPKPKVQIENVDELAVLKRQLEIAKVKKQLLEFQEPSFSSPLFNDCVEVLVGLGTPKRKAKAEAQQIFENKPTINTVQQFVTEYGKR